MIIGKLKEIEKYMGINKNLDRAITSIKNKEYLNGNPGKNIIDGEELFYNYDLAKTKEEAEGIYEIHKKYIDIQIPLDDDENYSFTFSKEGLNLVENYNEERDYAFYEGKIENKIKLTPEDFIIFFPEEPHMPLLMVENKKKIKKIIYKIKLK